MDEGGDIGERKVIKVRLKHIITAQPLLERIDYAVRTLQDVVSRALVFGKLLFMADLVRELATNGGVFDARVASSLSNAFPIGNDMIEEWMDVVSGPLEGRPCRPYSAEKMQRLRRLHLFYEEKARGGLLPATKVACTNLSTPKGYAAQQLAVNYSNNVHCHFDKYVRRFVRVKLTTMVRDANGLADNPRAQLPLPFKRSLELDIRAVCDDLLQARAQLRCREDLRPWVMQHRPMLMPPRTAGAAEDINWRFKSQKQHPSRWLPYMVMINIWLEEAGAKLLSPLLQRKSFVPSHIRLDTTGLIDLLVAGSDDTLLLKAQLEGLDMPFDNGSDCKYELPGLLQTSKKGGTKACKGRLYNDLCTILPPHLAERVKLSADGPIKHAATFKTALWKCITKLGSNQHASTKYNDLVFNNIIDTDGHAVSLHYVSPLLFGRTLFNGGFKEIKASQRGQKESTKALGSIYVTSLSPNERDTLLRQQGKVVSLDPGKGNLAVVTDGVKVVRYTAAQRRVESGATKHAKEQHRLQDMRPNAGARTVTEMLQSIGTGAEGGIDIRRRANSCIQQHYEEYLLSRSSVASDLRTFFQRRIFRKHRYDAHVGRRASEDKFASRIKNAFGNVSVILYGDWGRNPNLRHQPPSPGIGLRRRLCSYFKVLLVQESYTSSLCPCCQSHGLTKPRVRNGKEVHHLLRCNNNTCSCPWWNRDILGALNIMKKGMHALTTGVWDPVFAAP